MNKTPSFFNIFVFFSPFLFLGLTWLWVYYGVSPLIKDDLAIVAPQWWRQRGYSDLSWIYIGFTPAILCGMVSLTALVLGAKRKNVVTIGTAVWSCVCVPIITFFYMFATF